MNGHNIREDRTETTKGKSENRTKGRWKFLARVIIGCLFATVTLIPAVSYSQTLDEAVRRQLATDSITFTRCSELLGSDDTDVLTGALKIFCDEIVISPGTPSSSASGGAAGTPTTLPGIVTERLEEAREEGEKPETGTTDSAVELAKGLSLFISGGYEELDRKVTAFEDGYDSDIQRLTTGVDFQVAERLIVGLAVDAADQNGDFVGGGDFGVESYGVVAFGLFQPTERLFAQGYGGYTTTSNDRRRFATFTEEIIPNAGDPARPTVSISGSPDADFDTDQYNAGILTGYDYSSGGLTFGPRVGLDWIRTKFETYSEGGGDSGLELTFYDDEATSLQSNIGLGGSVATSTDFGVVTMQQSLLWKHEFDQDQREVEVSFVDDPREKRFTYETEEPDRDFFEFNVGLSLVLPNGVQGFANFRTLLGHSYFDSYAGIVGMRIDL